MTGNQLFKRIPCARKQPYRFESHSEEQRGTSQSESTQGMKGALIQTRIPRPDICTCLCVGSPTDLCQPRFDGSTSEFPKPSVSKAWKAAGGEKVPSCISQNAVYKGNGHVRLCICIIYALRHRGSTNKSSWWRDNAIRMKGWFWTMQQNGSIKNPTFLSVAEMGTCRHPAPPRLCGSRACPFCRHGHWENVFCGNRSKAKHARTKQDINNK